MEKHKNRGRNSRSRLQIGGALTVDKARILLSEKAERAAEKEAAKEARIGRQATNQACKQLRRAGIEARKQGRLRKKRVKALQKAGNPIPPEDQRQRAKAKVGVGVGTRTRSIMRITCS